MDDEIYTPGGVWAKAELTAMVFSGELFEHHEAYVSWNFLENAESRLRLLKRLYRDNIKPVGATAVWVSEGGRLPSEVVLQQPRRYC